MAIYSMRIRLQAPTPYQHSLRWQIHRDYYQQRGADVFLEQEVPFNVTSNPGFAEQLAGLVFEACRDMQSKKPVRILEIAGGLGVFALNFLDAWDRLCVQAGLTDPPVLEYWLTDFAAKTLKKIAQHLAFQERIAQGSLQLWILDALQPEQALGLDGTVRPLEHAFFDVMLANYHHCTLPAAVLFYKQGQFFELESENFGWLAGSPQEASTPEARLYVLQRLAERLGQLDFFSHVTPSQAACLQAARLKVINRMILPQVAQNWLPQLDLRLCLMRWLNEAVLAEEGVSEPESWAPLVQEYLIDPLFAEVHFSQKQLEEVSSTKKIDLETYLPAPLLRKVVREMLIELPEATFTLPVFSLQSLARLLPLLAPKGLMLLSDKGYFDIEQMAGLNKQEVSLHGDSIAQMVNFPLLQRWLLQQDIPCLRTSDPTAFVQTLMLYKGLDLPVFLRQHFETHFVERNQNNESQLFLEAGVQFLQAGKTQTALQYFLQALRYRPRDFATLLNVINTYYQLNMLQKARSYFEHPHDGYFYQHVFAALKAETYFLLQEFQAAIPEYQLALSQDPDKGLLHFHLAECFLGLGDKAQAGPCLERAQSLLPHNEKVQQVWQNYQKMQAQVS